LITSVYALTCFSSATIRAEVLTLFLFALLFPGRLAFFFVAMSTSWLLDAPPGMRRRNVDSSPEARRALRKVKSYRFGSGAGGGACGAPLHRDRPRRRSKSAQEARDSAVGEKISAISCDRNLLFASFPLLRSPATHGDEGQPTWSSL
jgi:hypothetical protein